VTFALRRQCSLNLLRFLLVGSLGAALLAVLVVLLVRRR
jgi:putative flippase GtrA